MKISETNCIIVHGCPQNPERDLDLKARYYHHWIPWVKRELISNGIKTDAPVMPYAWHPDYQKFKKKFEKYKVTNNTILIGHSCGCAFLVRWLGESKRKIKKLILVAPWKIPNVSDRGYRKKFYIYPIDEGVKQRVENIVMFTADNEAENGKKSLSIFHKALGGKIIELKGRDHYCFEDMGTEEFPELLKEVI